MLQLIHKQPEHTNTLHAPRMLVVGETFQSAWPLAYLLETAGYAAIPLPVAKIIKAEDLQPVPAAVVLAPELTTEDKKAVCAFLRSSATYKTIPIAAILTLTEGTLSLPVDLPLRLPIANREILARLRSLIEAQGIASDPGVA